MWLRMLKLASRTGANRIFSTTCRHVAYRLLTSKLQLALVLPTVNRPRDQTTRQEKALYPAPFLLCVMPIQDAEFHPCKQNNSALTCSILLPVVLIDTGCWISPKEREQHCSNLLHFALCDADTGCWISHKKRKQHCSNMLHLWYRMLNFTHVKTTAL